MEKPNGAPPEPSEKPNLLTENYRYFTALIPALAAFIIYYFTTETTVPLWDSGEFILAVNKLEIGHPPGSPFYVLLTRLLTFFAGSGSVAFLINLASGLYSAAAVFLLFNIIILFAERIIRKDFRFFNSTEKIKAIGGGLAGSLILAFSNTFWDNSIEAEVYSLSTAAMLFIFFLTLIWEKTGNNRLLLLIAFITGLAASVHLLTLLILPVTGMVIFTRLKGNSLKSKISGFAAGLAGIIYILVAALDWIPGIMARADLVAVNTAGLPYWSGALIFLALFILLHIFLVQYFRKKKNLVFHYLSISSLLFFIGLSSYAMVPIRSASNPAVDLTNPENPFTFAQYINREIYTQRPLFSGPYFDVFENNRFTKKQEGRKVYVAEKGKYLLAGKEFELDFDQERTTVFPRIYSGEPRHVEQYTHWLHLENGKEPGFGENLAFFFRYQIGHMYLRYFAWNFIGRANNDLSSHDEPWNGAWTGGLFFNRNLPVENSMSGSWYFFLPFLLGIAGAWAQFKQDKRGSALILTAFIMTGLAIAVYLNMPPGEVRERDYAFVGSFAIFSIWCGLAPFLSLKNIPGYLITAAGLATMALVFIMNLDTHDRSARQLNENLARNILASCEQDAVLITAGDNETYPLWYLQEVEDFRTDVKVINYSQFSTHQDIQSLQNPTSAGTLPFTFSPVEFAGPNMEAVIFYENPSSRLDRNRYYPARQLLDFAKSKKSKITVASGQEVNYFPTKKVLIPGPSTEDTLNQDVKLDFTSQALVKNDVLLLDFLLENSWERPVYFTTLPGSDLFNALNNYLFQEGVVFRLIPYRYKRDLPLVNTGKSFRLLMNEYRFDEMEDIPLEAGHKPLLTMFNNAYISLSNQLLNIGEIEKGLSVAQKGFYLVPFNKLPDKEHLFPFVRLAYKAKSPNSGLAMSEVLVPFYIEKISYINSLPTEERRHLKELTDNYRYYLEVIINLAEENGDKGLADKWRAQANSI